MRLLLTLAVCALCFSAGFVIGADSERERAEIEREDTFIGGDP